MQKVPELILKEDKISINSTFTFNVEAAKLPRQLLFTNKTMNKGFGKQNEFYKHISCNNPYWNVTWRLCSHRRISTTGKDKEWHRNTAKQLTTLMGNMQEGRKWTIFSLFHIKISIRKVFNRITCTWKPCSCFPQQIKSALKAGLCSLAHSYL